MQARIAARVLAITLVALFGPAAPVATPAACLDWSVAAPAEPYVAFTGPFFHDLGPWVMREGFQMRKLVTGSGHYYTQEVYVFDLRVPGQPLQVKYFSDSGDYFSGVTEYAIEDVDGDHCIVSVYANGGHARVLVTSSPGGVASANLWTFDGKVSLHGERAFQIIDDFFTWGIGVACLDISAPATPATLGQLDGSFTDLMALSEALVLMRTGDGRLQVADFTTPASPALRGSVTTAFTRWLGVAGGRVVIAAGTQTVGIDVSDPDAPAVAWSLPGAATAMTTDGDLMALALAGSGATLALYDIAGGTPVALSGAFGSEPSTTICLAIDGNVLYTGGICAYDIADPYAPQWLGMAGVTCNSAGGTATSSTLTVAGEQLITPHGLVWAHCASVAGVPGSPMALAVAAHPNPFNPTTTITFMTAQDGLVSVTIHDARGRLVRTLAERTLAAGPQVVRWDGRGDDGRPAAAGMYVARVATRDGVAAAKIVMAK